MYEKELLFISNQIKDIASHTDDEKQNIVTKEASTSEKLDSVHILNFLKFFV